MDIQYPKKQSNVSDFSFVLSFFMGGFRNLLRLMLIEKDDHVLVLASIFLANELCVLHI
jgi:hypothetical protein